MPKGGRSPHIKHIDRPPWVLFGSFSQRERTITFPTLQQSCRQPQSTILSQCSQVHTAQVTPLKLSRHTPAACGESQNPQALPQNIPSQSPSVTALPEGEPRGLQMSGCAEHAAGNPSAPAGQLPLHKGALSEIHKLNSEFRIHHSAFDKKTSGGFILRRFSCHSTSSSTFDLRRISRISCTSTSFGEMP